MQKPLEIIKRRRPKASELQSSPETPSRPRKSQSIDQTESSTDTSLDDLIETTEMPTSTEHLEAIAQPLPFSSPTAAEWQQELREIAWDYEQSVWEDVLYD